jgi:hypothetical protein
VRRGDLGKPCLDTVVYDIKDHIGPVMILDLESDGNGLDEYLGILEAFDRHGMRAGRNRCEDCDTHG